MPATTFQLRVLKWRLAPAVVAALACVGCVRDEHDRPALSKPAPSFSRQLVFVRRLRAPTEQRLPST
jgi:hypothetical protein